jgi:LPS-assembly protein
VQRYQTLQDPAAPIVPPYHRLPQLNAGVTRNEIGGVLDVSLPAEYVRFTHDTLRPGRPLLDEPRVQHAVPRAWHFFVPKLGVRYAEYSLSGVAAGQPERQTATIPWLSLDGGLTFERNAQWFGKGVTQTLEPRATSSTRRSATRTRFRCSTRRLPTSTTRSSSTKTASSAAIASAIPSRSRSH